MLAPSSVPSVSAPLSASFMLPVPDASVPAVEILLGEVGRGNHDLRERDSVVWKEDHLEPLANARIVIDALRDIVDELDDQLGHAIGGGRLACDDDGPRQPVCRGVGDDAIIPRDDMEHVEELAFVLVNALDLDIEE